MYGRSLIPSQQAMYPRLGLVIVPIQYHCLEWNLVTCEWCASVIFPLGWTLNATLKPFHMRQQVLLVLVCMA